MAGNKTRSSFRDYYRVQGICSRGQDDDDDDDDGLLHCRLHSCRNVPSFEFSFLSLCIFSMLAISSMISTRCPTVITIINITIMMIIIIISSFARLFIYGVFIASGA